MRVQWSQTLASSFKVCIDAKQCGVLSPILFALFVDSLLGRLEQSGVGCHICGHFIGVLAYAYADDVTLVVQSRSGIRTLCNICEHLALDYDITFNGTKCQLMFLKVDLLMFLLVAFMLMDNMKKFLSVQCTLVIPYPQVTEQKL